ESSTWYDLHLPRTMARLIRQENVHLIHSHLPDQNFYSCLVGRLTGSRTIVTYHGTPTSSETNQARCAMKLWCVRRLADCVVVVSDFLKKSLRDLKFHPDRIIRIHNGVDMCRFSASSNGRLRNELKCQNGTKLIGMVANVRESKGYAYFIQAARKV